MESVYVETTIPSYLTSRLSRDIVVAAQQQITREWWDGARSDFLLYVSEAVLDECSAGDQELAQRRLDVVTEFPILRITNEVIKLAETYVQLLEIPERAKVDAVHLSVAVIYEVDYLLTWNCKHLAHGGIRTKIHRYNRTQALHEPMIVTPLELMGGTDDEVE
ncbi:DNA-binding protein [Alicyclobacillaceae bacterium I2511]|nr:DNA-binding protein [Alicyclobacillaceae bacterium I2511]